MARLPALLVLLLITLVCVELTFADPVPVPGSNGDEGTEVPDGEDDPNEQVFTGDRQTVSKKGSIYVNDVKIGKESLPDKFEKVEVSVKNNEDGNESGTKLIAAVKSDLDTSSRIGCGRRCWCSLFRSTRCLKVPTRVLYASYKSFGRYGCYGKVFKLFNRICIRPKCCACITYLRA